MKVAEEKNKTIKTRMYFVASRKCYGGGLIRDTFRGFTSRHDAKEYSKQCAWPYCITEDMKFDLSEAKQACKVFKWKGNQWTKRTK